MAKADKDFRAGHLIAPRGDNALEGYRAALRLDPHNVDAKRGLSRLMHHYVKLAEHAMAKGQLDVAAQRLNVAEEVLPNASSVQQAWIRLTSATRAVKKNAEVQKQPNPVKQLLAEAKAHIEAQRLIQPTRKNALETYQAILALDPDNPDAKHGIAQIQDYYIQKAKNAWSQGKFETAREHLKRAENINPGTGKVERILSDLMSEPGARDAPHGLQGLF